MCGILYAQLKSPDEDFAGIFNNALKLMEYRGQDNIGYSKFENNYFGHVRLSILDLTARSNQPIFNSNYIILFKGEIYNYKKLDANAMSDTLAISNLLELKVDIRTKLEGMYGLLYFNKAENKVTVLRDIYGEKPIYYYLDENIFIVSSTIKSIIYILKHCLDKTLNINSKSVYEYFLSGYVREPRTIYDEIKMLLSGHSISFKNWNINIVNLIPDILVEPKSKPDDYINLSLQTSDVQPTLLLSSGVDSTYLLGRMEGLLDDYQIITYKSPAFEVDESSRALINTKKICKNGFKLNFIENPQNIFGLYEYYPKILEQPSSDGMQLFNILYSHRKTDSTAKLVILGTGGDELYGGYNSFKHFNKIKWLKKLHLFKELLPQKYQRFYYKFSGLQNSVESYYFLYRLDYNFLPLISNKEIQDIFYDFYQDMQSCYVSNKISSQQKIKFCETFDYMRNQLLRDADNISLYCSYEARNPLLAPLAYSLIPNNKKLLKNILYSNYRIKFEAKKGFTFAGDSFVFDYLRNKIKEYNDYYNLFYEDTITSSMLNNNFSTLKKIYNLLAWFSFNDIKPMQLQGITI